MQCIYRLIWKLCLNDNTYYAFPRTSEKNFDCASYPACYVQSLPGNLEWIKVSYIVVFNHKWIWFKSLLDRRSYMLAYGFSHHAVIISGLLQLCPPFWFTRFGTELRVMPYCLCIYILLCLLVAQLNVISGNTVYSSYWIFTSGVNVILSPINSIFAQLCCFLVLLSFRHG